MTCPNNRSLLANGPVVRTFYSIIRTVWFIITAVCWFKKILWAPFAERNHSPIDTVSCPSTVTKQEPKLISNSKIDLVDYIVKYTATQFASLPSFLSFNKLFLRFKWRGMIPKEGKQRAVKGTPEMSYRPKTSSTPKQNPSPKQGNRVEEINWNIIYN